MARHRNVRNLDFQEGNTLIVSQLIILYLLIFPERDYDEVFGRSLEDDVAISPATAGTCTCTLITFTNHIYVLIKAQFMYPRGQDNTSLSSYMRPHPQRHPIVPEIVTGI